MNKHIAKHLDQTFTRNSKSRRYSHCVIARPSEAEAERRIDSHYAVESGTRSYNYYCSDEAYSYNWIGGDRKTVFGTTYHSPAEFKADFPDLPSFLTRCREERVADFEKARAAGEFDTYGCVGWCGRYDLAVKLLNKTLGTYYDSVIILDAEIL